jgi:hypothetical protein
MGPTITPTKRWAINVTTSLPNLLLIDSTSRDMLIWRDSL